MDFYNYFSKAENIVQLISLVFFSVITILLFLKTGNVKHLERWLEKYFSEDNNFLGGADMKYRTEQTKGTSEAQSFDNTLVKYKLNRVTGKLEKVDKVDLQEMINSCLSSCLQNILDKFLDPQEPPLASGKSDIFEQENVSKDIDFILDYNSKIDALKQKYGLDEFTSSEDTIKYIHDYNDALKQKLAEKGGTQNEEKENVEES